MLTIQQLIHTLSPQSMRKSGFEEREIQAICFDSRQATAGCAYFCFEGIHTDGNLYIDEAIEKGAIVIISQKETPFPHPGITYIVTAQCRRAFAIAASLFYGKPEAHLKIIGITGTDGKTSTATFLYQLLKAKNVSVGLLSTVYMDNGEGLHPSPYRQSTPEANHLESFLAECLANKRDYVILEATSHALSSELDRMHAITFDLSIITTITSEHLEFHKTLDQYIESKCHIIDKLKQNGKVFLSTINPHLQECLSVAHKENKEAITLEKSEHIEIKPQQAVIINGKEYPCTLFPSIFITDALLACLAAASLLSLSTTEIYPLLHTLHAPTGRYHEIPNNLGFSTIIDFAHTKDAFLQLFSSIKQMKPQHDLILVFGAAGERDRHKRGQMGKVASLFARQVFITEEDPRDEDDGHIFADIISEVDATQLHKFTRIDKRSAAIYVALLSARTDETVLFLGKGHEKSIERKGRTMKWCENEQVLQAIKATEALQEKHIHVALIFGGRSPEHEVSSLSARGIYNLIKETTGNDPFIIHITKKGGLYLIPSLDSEKKITKEWKELVASPSRGLMVLADHTILPIDLVFDIIHGNEGEDGQLQSLLQMSNIRYCGSDPTASTLGMAKGHAQSVWEAHGLKTIPTLTFAKGDHIDFDTIVKKFPGKLIIKSETTGSSFGVTLLKDVKEYYLQKAINTAFSQSNRVLIQPYIEEMEEIECAILQLPNNTILPCGPGTVLSKKDKDNDIYSYESKYHGSGDSLLIPAPISEAVKEKIRADAVTAFQSLGCSGFARVDFFLKKDGTLYINEINTLPGLTRTSHFPLLVESEGIPLSSAISIIMEDALIEDHD